MRILPWVWCAFAVRGKLSHRIISAWSKYQPDWRKSLIYPDHGTDGECSGCKISSPIVRIKVCNEGGLQSVLQLLEHSVSNVGELSGFLISHHDQLELADT